MEDPHQRFFDQAKAAEEQAAALAAGGQLAAFEDAVVRVLLQTAGSAGTKQYQSVVFGQTGQRQFSLAWFNETFPGFPALLGAAKIDWGHQTTMWQLLDGFNKTTIFKACQAWLAAMDVDEDATGLAFIFRAKGRLYALHNLAGLPPIDGTQFSYSHGRVTYRLERLQNMLTAIGNGWFIPYAD